MSLTVVVGGQYGGEGKGLISAALCYLDRPVMVVKTGGPNCSHTFGFRGRESRLRMLPCGVAINHTTVIYPPGVLIHVDTLYDEIRSTGYTGRIVVDPKAGLVETLHIKRQAADDFYSSAGSTLTGTGAASADRALRRLRLARDEPRLYEFLGDSLDIMLCELNTSKGILIEGSQAYGLSNYHGDYPFTTSRDTTVGAFLSQVGLGPFFIGDIVLVLKAFPTRNSQGDGPLSNEINPDLLRNLGATFLESGGGSYGGSDKIRRVGMFDFERARRAVVANTPTILAITGMDKLSLALALPAVRQHYGSLDNFRTRLQAELGVRIGLESWGGEIEKVRDLRAGA